MKQLARSTGRGAAVPHADDGGHFLLVHRLTRAHHHALHTSLCSILARRLRHARSMDFGTTQTALEAALHATQGVTAHIATDPPQGKPPVEEEIVLARSARVHGNAFAVDKAR